jgi:YVTN family beta-propeller protein
MRDKVTVALAALLTVPMILIPSPALAADPSLGPTITVGLGPTGIAIAPDGATAYAANYNSNTVSVIRLSDNAVVASVGVGRTPTAVAIEPNGQFAYVANYDDPGTTVPGSVSRLDLSVSPIAVSPITHASLRGPVNIVFSPDGSKAYVANRGSTAVVEGGTPSHRISVIDTASNTVSQTIPVGYDSINMALSSDGNRLYVSHTVAGRISFVDLSTPTPTVTTPIEGLTTPQGLALVGEAGSQKLYVAVKGTGSASSIRVYNANTGDFIRSVTGTGLNRPESMTLNGSQAAATQLYVANRDGNDVRIVDLSNDSLLPPPASPLSVGTAPFEVAFAPNGLEAYVTNFGSGTVRIITITPRQDRTLSFETTSFTVAYGATQTVTATPSGGAGVGTLTYSAGASDACTVDSATGVVTMIAPTGTCSIAASISQGGSTADDAFKAASTVTPVTITPTTAALEITAGSETVTVGAAVTPSFSVTSGSLVSSDVLSGVTFTYEGTGSTAYAASTTAPTAVGTYSVTPSAATFSTGNAADYAITYVAGSLVIQAPASDSSGAGSPPEEETSAEPVVVPAPPASPVPAPRQLRPLPVPPSTAPTARPIEPPDTAPVAQPVERPGLSLNPNTPVRGSVAGAPTSVSTTVQGSRGLSVAAGVFQLGFSLRGPSGAAVAVDTPSRSPELQIPRGQAAAVSGGGSYPGSLVQLWLPGNDTEARELARIPVRSDGTFVSDLTFGAGPLEMPVPIGRQVLQVVGYDGRGNQTVVEMTINIGQGVPAPEPDRQVGALPALPAGQSLATSGGIPEAVVVRALPDARNVTIEGTGWAMGVNVDRVDAVGEDGDGDAIVRLERSSTGTAGGSGFLPGTLATVWLFSDPTLMATVTVDDTGSFSADFLIDGRLIAPGEHTLQIQGVGADGFIKAANLGVVVDEPSPLTSRGARGLPFWVVGSFLGATLIGAMLVAASKRRRRSA